MQSVPLGTPVILQREFLSRAVIIVPGGTCVLELMQCLHENCAPLECEPLMVDDSLGGRPVHLFDVRIPQAQVPTEYGPFSLRLTVCAIEGDHDRFELVTRRVLQLVVVVDTSGDPATRMIERWLQRLAKLGNGRGRRLHLLWVTPMNAAGEAPFPVTAFASVHRVRSLDDPRCSDAITAVAADIVGLAASRTSPG
jgi:hypothetical protein